jgi:hypothetical protein
MDLLTIGSTALAVFIVVGVGIYFFVLRSKKDEEN